MAEIEPQDIQTWMQMISAQLKLTVNKTDLRPVFKTVANIND